MSRVPNFYHHPGVLDYSFGEWHPLKPERMRRTLTLLHRLADVDLRRAELASEDDLRRVHAPEYVEATRSLSENPGGDDERRVEFGFYGDNPPFAGMWEAARAYVGAVASAARDVRDGAPLAFGIGGGLHHAHRARASGFCVFNDLAVAVSILRERYARVAYVDVDVHHGDGVQFLFYDDPAVLTCSIHEEGRTLYPGTGEVEEVGPARTSLNVPLPARTHSEVWLEAFRRGVLPVLERFRPEAIVLQMGTDPHFLDPLAHLSVGQGHWLGAIREVRDLGLPLVAVGGGGYHVGCVPRMWVSAILELSGVAYDDAIPADLAQAWDTPTFSDPHVPGDPGAGRPGAERTLRRLEELRIGERSGME